MQEIIEEKFREWTAGLSQEEGRIRIFEEIRDIPYAIFYDQLNLANGPSAMLRRNKGSCTPKHYLLGMMYEKLEIDVRYCTYPFKWEELDAGYPDLLQDLADKLPVTYHLACKAFIEEKWVLIDATWDRALEHAGFPVNDDWDGRRDTVLAVKPVEEFVHEDAQVRDEFFKEKMAVYTLPEKLELSRFSGEFNKWLKEIRNSERSARSEAEE